MANDSVVNFSDLNLLLVLMKAEEVLVADRAIGNEGTSDEGDELSEESFHKFPITL